MEKIYKQIDEKIRESENIAVFMHASPDGDAIGSGLALYEMISSNFPQKKIDVINKDTCEIFYFLPNADKVIESFNIDDYDLIITVDMAVIKLCGFGDDREIFKDKFLINIDHHPTNTLYGDINLVNIDKPSATLVLYDFFDYAQYKMNKNIANCLLTGIYTDTGSFIYSNVTTNTFNISSKLINLGAQNTIINDNFFSNLNFNFLNLYSLVLERFIIKENFALSYLKNEDLEKTGCSNDDVGSIVSRLNELDGVDYVLFLHEKGEIVKGSLRTHKESVDLIELAKIYNGGGHKKASGYIIEGKIEIDEKNNINIRSVTGELIKF